MSSERPFEAEAEAALEATLLAHRRAFPALAPAVAALAARMATSLDSGGKIVWLGNGGSAAQAQHASAELVCKFERDRRSLASISLTVDTSILTAIGNDYGYREVFVRQVTALVRPGDVVVGLTTSGRSTNVIAALEAAREAGGVTVALTGTGTEQLSRCCDQVVSVDAERTGHIQEAHLVIIHLVCGLLEARLLAEASSGPASSESP